MRILFLDQSGKLGGAELSLMDVASPYRDNCLVGLFADGPFHDALEARQIPVQVLSTHSLKVRKDSNLWHSLGSLSQLAPLVSNVVRLSRSFDVIYTNTQKALVVGAIASFLTRRPLIYHLRDILSPEHFSRTNLRVAITMANLFATRVIANSRATRSAFIAAGGRSDLVEVVYNGFEPERYQAQAHATNKLRYQLKLDGKFVVGHFSRLSPWKGQHILIEALAHCPENVTAVLVGDALFGEQDYVQQLHQQVATLKLQERVKFLGFRSDVSELMGACDLVAHTSTAPEPFGRVIVEAMLCGTPVVAAEAGGAVELVEHGITGWFIPPDDSLKLATVINQCHEQPEQAMMIAKRAQGEASQRFHLTKTHQQIAQILDRLEQPSGLKTLPLSGEL